MKNSKQSNKTIEDTDFTGLHLTEIADVFNGPGDREEIVNEQEQNEVINEEEENETVN